MFIKKLRFIVVTLLLCLFVGVQIANAQTSTTEQQIERERASQLVDSLVEAENPEAFFASLSAKEQKLTIEYGLKAVAFTEEVTNEGDTLGNETEGNRGCGTVTVSRSGYNLLGNRLWTWKHAIYRCWNGSTLTSINANPYGVTYFPFWNWSLKGRNQWGNVGSRSAYRWAQGEFKLCVNGQGWGCVQHSYPYAHATIYGTGAHRWGAGG